MHFGQRGSHRASFPITRVLISGVIFGYGQLLEYLDVDWDQRRERTCRGRDSAEDWTYQPLMARDAGTVILLAQDDVRRTTLLAELKWKIGSRLQNYHECKSLIATRIRYQAST